MSDFSMTRRQALQALGATAALVVVPSLPASARAAAAGSTSSAPSTQPFGGLPAWYEDNRVQAYAGFTVYGGGPLPDGSGPQQVWYYTPDSFDHVAQGIKALGASVMQRDVKTRDEDPWWPSLAPLGPNGEHLFDDARENSYHDNSSSTGRSELPVPAGLDLPQQFVSEADANGVSIVGYYKQEFDYRAATDHPEWICLLANGQPNSTAYGGGYGTVMDVTSDYKDIVQTRLLELAQRGIKGFYFDSQLEPPGGSWTAQAEADFETQYGVAAPTVGDLRQPVYWDWLNFRDVGRQDAYSGWKTAVTAQSPGTVFCISVTFMASLTLPQSSSTKWGRIADSLKSEYHNAISVAGRGSLWPADPTQPTALTRPADDTCMAVGFILLRDCANGRPPRIWGSNFPNRDHCMGYASSVVTFGAVADLYVSPYNLFETVDERQTPRQGLIDAFALGNTVSPYLAGTRPLRWAAVHFSEHSRNMRGRAGTYGTVAEMFTTMWQEVLWPFVGGFEVLHNQGVPVNVIDDDQMAGTGLDGYQVLYLTNPDDLTATQQDQLASFEAGGGVVVANSTDWQWSDPSSYAQASADATAAFASAVATSPVRVDSPSAKVHACSYTLPADQVTARGYQLAVAVSNDYSFVQLVQAANYPYSDVNPTPDPASGVTVDFAADAALPAGSSATLHAYEIVSDTELPITYDGDRATVTLPDFPFMSLLVLSFDPSATQQVRQ